MNKLIFIDGGSSDYDVGTGVNGVGFAYPLNSGFYIDGGVGVGVWRELSTQLLR